MNSMRKLIEAVEQLNERGRATDSVKVELKQLISVAKELGLGEAADYIAHVLEADYDSLDYFDPYNKDLPMMLRRQAESVNEDSDEVETEIQTWFERDRAYVGLNNVETGETIIEWWDEDVAQAVEDGFLDPSDWHSSAIDYAKHLDIL